VTASLRVLGISAFLDDPSAALLIDGKIVAIAEEERFSRVKHGVRSYERVTFTTNEMMSPFVDVDVRLFPWKSIQFCLSEGCLDWKDLDFVALSFDFPSILRNPSRYARGFPGLPRGVLARRRRAFRDYIRHLRSLCSRGRTRLVFVPHHDAHTAGACFSSTARRCNILTMDGMGEFEAVRLSTFNGFDFETVSLSSLPHSVGRVYGAVTDFLGFRMNRDEEKVMALAGYGSDTFSSSFRALVRTSPRGFRIQPRAFWTRECEMGFLHPSPLPRILGVPKRPSSTSPLDSPYPDIARSLQETLYRVTSHFISQLDEVSGYRDLCLAGGVALNCDNNGRILTTVPSVKNLWIQPQAGDSGAALGAAYWVHFEETGLAPEPMRHAFYGPGFSEEEVETVLRNSGVKYRRSADVSGEAAEHVGRGEIIGWFQGRAEAGPRALGSRSILAMPNDKTLSRRVNERIKHREPWRPFAPSVLEEQAETLLQTAARDRFMTIAVPVTQRGQKLLSGTTHVTGTTRAQTVPAGFHDSFRKVLEQVEKLTGVPALLNTSFNDAGEPIVNDPVDALRNFYTTGLDFLAIGPFVVKKRSEG